MSSGTKVTYHGSIKNIDNIEYAIQIIMGDWEADHSQSLMVSFAELFQQCYYSKITKTTFYTILLVSEGSLLAIVANSFLASVQLPSQASVFFSRFSAYLRFQLQIWASVVRLFIVLLNLTVVLSLLALIFRSKQHSRYHQFLMKYLHYLVTTLLTLSVPFLYFSIGHIFADQSFQTYFSDIIDALNVICLMGCIYAFQLFGVEAGSECPDTSVLRSYRNNGGNCRIMKLAVIFLLTVHLQGLQWGLFCLFILQLIQLKCLSHCRKYINSKLQSLSQLISTVWISSYLVMLFASNFPAHTMDNLAWVFGTVTFLLYNSVRNYIRYQRRKVMMLGEGVQREEQAIRFVWEYLANLYMAAQRGDMTHRLLIGLQIQKHQARCMEAACKCQEKRSSWTNSSDLVNLVTEQLFEKLLSKFPYLFCLKFMAIWFKISHSTMIINANHEISQFLKKKNVKAFSFAQMFIVKETKRRIRGKMLYYKCVDNHIKAENIFLEQSIKGEAQVLISNIIQENIQKYKLLLQDFYTLNAIQSCCLRINKGICAMEQIWRRVCLIDSSNHQLYRLFIFYYQNVVSSQIEGKKITREITLKLDKLKHLRGFSKDIINKYIYSRKSCVIQSNLQKSFGVITNVSKFCMDVLGRRKEELLHKDINAVMPEYFAKSHEQSMQLWLQTCTISKYQTDIVEIGYVDAMQTCFQGCFLMKIFPGEDSLLFYSVIIRENDNDYILLNHRGEIEGIGKRFIKQGIFSSENIKHRFNEYGSFNFDKKITQGQKCRANIFLQNTTLSNRPEYPDENQTSSDQQFSPNRLAQSLYQYECTVCISKHSIGREFYYLIKFQNITKWASSSCRHIQAQQRIGQGISGWMGTNLKLIDKQLLRVDENESVEPVTNKIRFTQLLNISIKNSSLTSSSFNEAAYYNHFIKDIKRRLVEPTLLGLPHFGKMTALLLIMSAAMCVQFLSLRQLFSEGFRSFNDVMFGDGAVSDNNQILEILYNDVHMSRIYCSQQLSSPRCQYLLNSTASLSNILYELYLQDVQVYLQNKTTLSGLKFYASYDIPVNFSLGANSSSKQISTLQFMEYFYGASKKLHNEVEAGRGDSAEADFTMRVLLSNWQTMKFVNHNAIYFYLDAGQVELDMLLKYLLLLGASLVFCIVALGIGLKEYQNSVLKKKEGIMAIHGCMTDQLLRDITDYYFYLKEVAQDLSFLPDIFQPSTDDHSHHENRREMKYNQSRLCLMRIIIVVVLISLLGSVEILKIGLVLPSCMKMVSKINNLMDSENYLLENYFQLKTYYLTYNFSKSVDQISSEISVRLNQTEPVFTQVAKGSIDIFSTDPTFTQDFNDLLIKDVCQLTAWVFQPWQVLYCMYNFTTPVLQHGLVNAMTFFQRNAFAALTELQSKQEQNINKTAYFQQDVFKDIDDSIFYMFRLYQATQARMYQGLTYSVSSSLPFLDAINTAAISLLLLVVCWWLKSFRGQQREMCQLYGTVLQFPQATMKAEIIAKIKNILELED